MITHLHIETTSKCNAKCVFCPHKDMKREKADMTDEVLDEVLRQMDGWSGVVCPFLNGEMFLDTKVWDRMERLQAMGPHVRFGIHTNGSLLTEVRINNLKQFKMTYFMISLQATNAEEHRQRTGLSNWQWVLDMIRSAVQVGLNPLLVFNDTLDVAEAQKLAQSLGATPHIAYTYTWREKVGAGKHIPPGICNWPFGHVFILSNGDIVPCCMDLEGEMALGNVMRNDIREVYKGPLAEYRDQPKSSHVFCRTCNMPERR